jgi:hypothetical protein
MKCMVQTWISVAVLMAAGCQSSDLGSGTNTVDREFAKPASDVWKASVKSVESMDLTVSSDAHDRMGGDLVARRADGGLVRVWVKALDEKHSQVSVRVEPGDRAMATMLQENIAGMLGLGEARSGLLGGNSIDGVYCGDLAVSMLSARRALRSLHVTITEDETHAEWARIDGRLKDSTPVRIRIDQVEDQKTKVTFIAGNEKSEDNKAFAHRMKEEYEAIAEVKGSSD